MFNSNLMQNISMNLTIKNTYSVYINSIIRNKLILINSTFVLF